ncbi:MAG: hypothetical protein JZU63_08365, partial [Rhodoferax sp.]|nr:hypothetical protein [Rhodoferax sp.]
QPHSTMAQVRNPHRDRLDRLKSFCIVVTSVGLDTASTGREGSGGVSSGRFWQSPQTAVLRKRMDQPGSGVGQVERKEPVVKVRQCL